MIFEIITVHLKRSDVIRLIEASAIMQAVAAENHDEPLGLEWSFIRSRLSESIPDFDLANVEYYER